MAGEGGAVCVEVAAVDEAGLILVPLEQESPGASRRTGDCAARGRGGGGGRRLCRPRDRCVRRPFDGKGDVAVAAPILLAGSVPLARLIVRHRRTW